MNKKYIIKPSFTNRKIEELYNKIDGLNLIINHQALEISQLKEQLATDIDRYEDTISYQLGFEKGKEEIKEELLEFIKNLKGGDKEEFMGYGGYELLEILGGKNENNRFIK